MKLLSYFKYGFITIITSPLIVLILAYHMIEGLILYIAYLFKAIILFFAGKSIFETQEDKAIKKMMQDEGIELESRRKEALKDVE